jgi:very-short-patch-repair endonuclease
VIEVDGAAHDFSHRAEHDTKRDAYMRALGLAIIRIPAADLMRDPDAVAQALVDMCAAGRCPSTTQLR